MITILTLVCAKLFFFFCRIDYVRNEVNAESLLIKEQIIFRSDWKRENIKKKFSKAKKKIQ